MVHTRNGVAYQGYNLLENTWGGRQASHTMYGMAVQTVPSDKSYGYEALTHGDASTNGSGYWNITSGYPSYKANCTKFRHRKCHSHHTPHPHIPRECRSQVNSACEDVKSCKGSGGNCVACPPDQLDKCDLVQSSQNGCVSQACWAAEFGRDHKLPRANFQQGFGC